MKKILLKIDNVFDIISNNIIKISFIIICIILSLYLDKEYMKWLLK